jgi:hypothetical protein
MTHTLRDRADLGTAQKTQMQPRKRYSTPKLTFHGRLERLAAGSGSSPSPICYIP